MTAGGLRHLVHADWSKDPKGRWTANARRDDGCWRVSGPCPVGLVPDFVDRLIALGAEAPTLAGFDFPIGLPARYGAKTGFPDFRAALASFGIAPWERFFEVAATQAEISARRPFYPARPGGTALRHLLDGHGVATVAEITRLCERGGPGLPPAGCMFWTMGAKQVGKGALHGWRHVIAPALRRGAKLWPFDGDLPGLAGGGLTLAETYPGDAYGQIGLSLKGLSKARLADRQSLAPVILAWASRRGLVLDDGLVQAIETGFPPDFGIDNGFDAVIGLLAIIAVVSGERPDGAPTNTAVRRWEGWILGRASPGA